MQFKGLHPFREPVQVGCRLVFANFFMKIVPFLSRPIRALAAASLLILATGCNPHTHPAPAAAATTPDGKDIHPHNPHTHPNAEPMLGSPGPHP